MKKTAQSKLLETLKARFEENAARHPKLSWDTVAARLAANPKKVAVLEEMEATGGEPDVVAHDPKTGELTFFDCSEESPAGRRSLCYDAAALAARKENKPKGSAVASATKMGVALLTEDEYARLQQLGAFDLKTSSWIETPAAIRKLGGALYGDRRYDRVFTGHNGADSYYAARGFRGAIKI